jgi:hypothetical protein
MPWGKAFEQICQAVEGGINGCGYLRLKLFRGRWQLSFRIVSST